MSNTKFKITKDGVTRRVTFSSQPSWNALSARIHTLFGIPIGKIGVSYIDADSDEVTLSSEDELRDYYQAFPANEVTKFVVHDLTRNEKSLPDTPRSTAFRNTFGIDTEGLGIEDEWQPLNLGGVFVNPLGGSDSPQAHIETVDSDSMHNRSDVSEDESDDSTTDFGHVTFTRDKGKGKAVDPSPAPSVAADSNSEEPILFETQASRFPDTPARSVSSVFEPVSELKDEPQEASTPKAAPVDVEAEDPPLPTIDPTSPPQPSLTNDVATLLTTLSNVVSTHPELSEGLRNIIQNATNGIYWNSHRASMSQAAGDFVQATGEAATDLRRRAEDEAGQRVAEAIGGMVRSFSQVLGAENTAAAEPAAAAASAEDHDHPWRTSTPPGGFNSSSFWYGAPPPMWAGAGARGRGGRRGSWGGPHHGPPFHHGPHPMPGPHGGPPGAPRGFGPFPPPRGPPGSWPQFGQWAPPVFRPAPGPPPSHNTPAGPAPPAEPPVEGEAAGHPKPTPQELRAQVEAAKLLYKVEKERYRAEREERRKLRAERTASGPPADTQPLVDTSTNDKAPEPTAPTVAYPVSAGNAKVGYPPLEMYSVPHRSKTYHGRPTRRHNHEDVPETASERTINRITKRLAAMGITDKAHPSLPAKIKEQLPAEGTISEETENNIVSTLVEELLFMSPKPAASGSGLREAEHEVPGAWP
ncbi:hypothetical protein C8R47DRAFT_1210636 [Mycena vitilis]|nr:hypothetical protein C8R47DRAFT_1210636 [Mycena vitilis]